jgi:hypothetical protein
MDYSRHEYVPYEGRPNVLLAYFLGTPAVEAKKHKIDPVVLATARLMFKKAPRNTYIFTGPKSDTNDTATFTICTVERDGEVLGTLRSTYGRKGASVAVGNDKITAERDRGGSMITSDEKRAAALALKKFLPTSSEESMMKGYGALNEKMRTLVNQVNGRKTNALQQKSEAVLRYVEKHWDDEGQALLTQVGVPPSELDAINAAIEEQRKFLSLRQRHEKGLTFVMLKGDTLYAVPFTLNAGSPDLHQRAYPYADAPGDMRAKVGMLKIAEEGVYHADYGMRIGDYTFVIFFDLDAPLPKEDNADDEDD